MSDEPVRLREGGSPFLKKALMSARSETPDETRAAALEARILPLLLPPVPPAPPPGTPAVPKLGAGAGTAGSAAKGLSLVKGSVLAIAAAALLAGAGAGAIYVTQVAAPPSTTGVPMTGSGVVPSAMSPVSPSASSSGPGLGLVPMPSSTPSAVASHKATSLAPSASAHEVADPDLEAPLLRSAQDALRGNPGEALAKAQEHAKKYPRGLLVQEREVIAIEALLKLGRRDEAVGRSVRFSKSFPGSTHQRRIDALLGETK